MYILARLTGRCADGAQRGGGVKIHWVPSGQTYGTALCGAKPGRLSSGWDEMDGPETPTCPRCQAKVRKGDGLMPNLLVARRGTDVEVTYPRKRKIGGKLHLVIEDPNYAMDSGCTHQILQECTNHGKVLEAYFLDDDGEIRDIMFATKGLVAEPEKC